ncbi:MAG: diguanylate cyclase [Kangiellaceae bacterium]|nr:diguanylate cyclase [Kangiellaceae bacterium]
MEKLRFSWKDNSNEGSTIFELTESAIAIGRANSNDVILSHASISRHHASINRTPHGIFIQDLGSRFGTYVDGVAIKPKTPVSIELNSDVKFGSLVVNLSAIHSERKTQINPEFCTKPLYDAVNDLQKVIQNSSDSQQERKIDQAFSDANLKIDHWTLQNNLIHQIYLLLNHTPSYESFLAKMLPMLVNVLKAERGFILRFDKHQRKLVSIASHKYTFDEDGHMLDSNNLFSQTIARRCFDENDIVLVADACTDEALVQTLSIKNFSIKSAVAIPLSYGNKIMGVVYLDHCSEINHFNETQNDFIRSLQIHASTALKSTIHYSQAITDDLTGLYTRKYFEKRIRQTMEQSLRYNSQCSLLLLDIDHFKAINDTYGHNCGDEVLKAVSQLLTDSARKSDVVGRLGGEEFVFLLSETNELGAIQYAERLRTDIANLVIRHESVEVSITASFGIASYHSRLGTMEYKFIEEADQAMYLAKKAGRDRVEAIKNKFVDAMQTQVVDPTITE